MHNVQLIRNNHKLQLNDVVSDSDKKIEIEWGTNGYYELTNTKTGITRSITPAVCGGNKKNLFERIWNYLTFEKPCSSRSGEADSVGGLADVMSQTFYLIVKPDGSPASFEVPTTLLDDDVRRLLAVYEVDGVERSFVLRSDKNKITVSSGDFIQPRTDRASYRVSVYIVDGGDGKMLLTDSMDVIIYNNRSDAISLN
jgi:ribosomal protein S30